MMGYTVGLVSTIIISNKLLLVFALSVIWVACGAQACVIGYTVGLASKTTMSDRPPGGKFFKLPVSVRTGQLQTLAFLILVCLILEGTDSRWLLILILYGLSNEIIPTLNEKIGHLDLKILYYLIKMFIRNERMLFFRSSMGWRLKILYLHLNLFPRYIWTHFWDWTWFCLRLLMGLVLYPWIGWLEYPVYYAATIYATFGILFATATEQFKLWK